MLRVAVRKVNPGHVESLRRWLIEVGGPRRQEALATLASEGCTHEMVLLVEGEDGPLVVYVMEVDDVDRSIQAAKNSTHRIDADHKRMMGAALADAVPYELLLDLRP